MTEKYPTWLTGHVKVGREASAHRDIVFHHRQ